MRWAVVFMVFIPNGDGTFKEMEAIKKLGPRATYEDCLRERAKTLHELQKLPLTTSPMVIAECKQIPDTD